MIAFYYGITAIACPIYFRRQLLRGPLNLLTLGLLPLVGAVGLGWVFIRTAIDLSEPASSASHTAILGIGLPLVLAGGLLVVGLVLLALTAWRSPSFPGKLKPTPTPTPRSSTMPLPNFRRRLALRIWRGDDGNGTVRDVQQLL